jgi:hypothetical protein
MKGNSMKYVKIALALVLVTLFFKTKFQATYKINNN